jgi:hypothetical protein
MGEHFKGHSAEVLAPGCLPQAHEGHRAVHARPQIRPALWALMDLLRAWSLSGPPSPASLAGSNRAAVSLELI